MVKLSSQVFSRLITFPLKKKKEKTTTTTTTTETGKKDLR